ncbi:MAG: DUF4373 domain-containing protein, partial [Gammaproteobacteria bacterium]
MKWFKHDSFAATDPKLRKLRMKFGAEGYGLYWYILERIAAHVDVNDTGFELEDDEELIAADLGMGESRVVEALEYMAQIVLLEKAGSRYACPKMASRADRYTSRFLGKTNQGQTGGNQHTNYASCEHGVFTRSAQGRQMCAQSTPRIEENRREQNRRDKTVCAERISAPTEKIALPLKNGNDYLVTNDDLTEWRAAVPGVDVLAELRKMRLWLDANPSKRKTPKGIRRFVASWLSRE